MNRVNILFVSFQKAKAIFDPSDDSSQSKRPEQAAQARLTSLPLSPVDGQEIPLSPVDSSRKRTSFSSGSSLSSQSIQRDSRADSITAGLSKPKRRRRTLDQTPQPQQLVKRVADVAVAAVAPVTAKAVTYPANHKDNNSVQPRSLLKPVPAAAIVCVICKAEEDPSKPLLSMTSCKLCPTTAHTSCVRNRLRKGQTSWTCRSCITCTVCQGHASRRNDIITCAQCLADYHYQCHSPRPEKTATWSCTRCTEPLAVKLAPAVAANVMLSRKMVVAKAEEDSEDDMPIRARQELRDSTWILDKNNILNEFQGKPVPDASKWSADQVYNFFHERFPIEATKLREQEIDGVSLLLMRRNDVLQGLDFKLGPALRIYKQIVMLQTRNADPRLTWF